jgi:AraC-like DNA-binding protein
MEPKFLQKNTKSAENSFYSRYAEVPHTYDQFHYHKEYELLYTIENHGTRFIGDHIASFSNGDFVLVGPGLPHFWQSDKEYYQDDPFLKAKVVLIHFEKDFLGTDFFDLPEMRMVKTMLLKSNRGLKFPKVSESKIADSLVNIVHKTGWSQVLDLINILCQIAELPYTQIASEGFSQSYSQHNEEEKITGIYNFLIQNHEKDITLSDVSEYANMNPSAFCRYFKKITSKTLSDSLNEIRVGVACKKLINTDLSISEIGYGCGYQSVSYFNRQFKLIKQINPTLYREKYQKQAHG